MTITSINTETRALVDADSTSYPDALLLIRTNNAYEEIVSNIIGYNGTWQFDDSNFTDFPIGISTLVEGQNDYAFDVTHLDIEGISVKDSGGIWQKLTPIDKDNIGVDMAEFMSSSGMPQYYDKQGNSLILYPAPTSASVTLTSGLKVYFQRTACIFTSAEVTTGTKVPGFASTFHVLISYKAALPYAMSYKKDRVPGLLSEINRLENLMEKHYSNREKDVRKALRPSGIQFR